MKWYNYIACFFAGVFLANFVPHFVQGVCGNAFPTPFSKIAGKGLSSPMINLWWGLFNLVAGYLLFRAGKISNRKTATILIFFAGIVFCSIINCLSFADKIVP